MFWVGFGVWLGRWISSPERLGIWNVTAADAAADVVDVAATAAAAPLLKPNFVLLVQVSARVLVFGSGGGFPY